MSFYEIYRRYKDADWGARSGASRIPSFFDKEYLSESEFASLLSKEALPYLEDMAVRAHGLTMRYFGKTIQLYTPMYLSNYCENGCVYCGFNANNKIVRRKLSMDEVEKEAAFIASTGLKHILILTGESRNESPLSYIKECVGLLKKYFTSISIEIYPLTGSEYADLVREGVDGLTLYQEVYDERLYAELHPAGPKSDYRFRLDAPERGSAAGLRAVNIGVLLGLADWRKEIFLTGLHARYLQDTFPGVEIGVSVPRFRPHVGPFRPKCKVTDEDVVQAILALRLFLPRAGITVSTREDPCFRENLIGLGVTRMSAGSSTEVGGHTLKTAKEPKTAQFEISDTRNVEEVISMLRRKGYQPVLKDWVTI